MSSVGAMLPYGRQSIDEEDIAAVVEVLRGDWLTTGPAVAAFEDALSAIAGGLPAVSTTSGTAALHTAYAAVGVGPGDEVVTTPLTFIATAATATLRGATVVFADVDEDTALIEPASVEAVVTERTAVIAAVDYAGQPADYAGLQPIADRVGALTLADAAHSIGGTAAGVPVGALADVTTMSFFPTKNVTTAEGGAVIARDGTLARRAREFHRLGMVRDPDRFVLSDEGPWHQEVQEFGLNYRLSDVACALGLSQVRRLGEFKRRRTEIVTRYDAMLAEVAGLRIPGRREDVDPMWHLYPIRVLGGRRREVFERMRSAGIGVQVNYLPVYRHPVYAELGYRRGLCPRAEAYYAQQLSLPLHPSLSDADVDRVIETLTGILR